VSKSPEELAEEYIAGLESQQEGCCNQSYGIAALEYGFLAGYQAAAPQWISVKDRLPPPQTEVLWWNKAAQQAGVSSWEYMSYCDDTRIEWGDAGNLSIRKFTHWMPLPEPPEEV
jgi:hypothetical protein